MSNRASRSAAARPVASMTAVTGAPDSSARTRTLSASSGAPSVSARRYPAESKGPLPVSRASRARSGSATCQARRNLRI